MATLEITKDKVRDNTADSINGQIDAETDTNIDYYKKQSSGQIRARIIELDREWDIERVLELNASLIAFGGVVLAATRGKRWLLLPGIVSFFLTQHAVQGWCPPLWLFRRMKVRTRKEIDKEKYALLEMLNG